MDKNKTKQNNKEKPEFNLKKSTDQESTTTSSKKNKTLSGKKRHGPRQVETLRPPF